MRLLDRDADRLQLAARTAQLIGARRLCQLIIDDTMADLWLDQPPPLPLAAHDRAARVISLGSMGKSFWGGLRIGWIRADRQIISALNAARSAVDMGSPIIEQLAATILLRDAEPPLRERRDAIREQCDHLLGLVGQRFPEWRFEVPDGGLSAWAELPRPVSTALAAVAHRHGVRVAPGNRFGIGGAFERFIRLPYALPANQLTDVVSRLLRAWDEVGAAGTKRPKSSSASLTDAI